MLTLFIQESVCSEIINTNYQNPKRLSNPKQISKHNRVILSEVKNPFPINLDSRLRGNDVIYLDSRLRGNDVNKNLHTRG